MRSFKLCCGSVFMERLSDCTQILRLIIADNSDDDNNNGNSKLIVR